MPAEVMLPLAVRFVLPGGVVHLGALHDLPDPVLAADLAAGLVAATHPHGPIRTRSVARQYMTTMRRMARDLHTMGLAGGLPDLSTASLVRYWLTCDYHRERRIRAVLSAFENTCGGLDAGIRAHLAGRRINQATKSQPNRPYSDGEWRRLEAACMERITASHQDETGVFPDSNTALSYLTLFAMRTGIVPDGIDGLKIGNITRTSKSTILLSYRKGRTGDEALNLPRAAVRLLDRWLKHSAPLRERADELSGHLWLFHGPDRGGLGSRSTRIYTNPREQARRRRWVAATGLLDDNGNPFPLHGGRIRATFLQRRDHSAWTGRVTIDPNHSAKVEGDHYPAPTHRHNGTPLRASSNRHKRTSTAKPGYRSSRLARPLQRSPLPFLTSSDSRP